MGIIVVLIIIAAIVVLSIILSSIFTVKQQTVAIIERFGKYKRTVDAGLHLKWFWGIEQIVARPSLRVSQLDLQVETKTLDDVFVVIKLAIQYLIPSIDHAMDAYYKLVNPREQMDAWVFDVVRAKVPKMKLDDVFEKKDEVAIDVQDSLKERMQQYGFEIVRALVNDIEPDAKVKNAMNEVNTQQRLQVAASAEGEKNKILIVKKAEAEAESKKLQGIGIANERKAIIDGYRDSIASFMKGIPGTSAKDVTDMVVITQYFDTLTKLGADSRSKVVFVPSNPGAVGDFINQIRTAIASAEEVPDSGTAEQPGKASK